MPFEIVGSNKIITKYKDKKNIPNENLTEGSNMNCCRICWGTEEELQGNEFNPLISPCNCTGTMGFIHLKCLK